MRTSKITPDTWTALPVAARRLHVSLHRAIGMIHEGQLRATLSGARWWVETRSLEALLRARRRSPGGGGRAA